MRRWYCLLLVGGVLLFASAPAAAQTVGDADDLSQALRGLGQEYADNYTQPLTDALGAGLHAGLFRTAEVGGGGIVPAIDLYLGVSAMGINTNESAESFRLSNEEIQTDAGRTLLVEYPNTDLPTAFGENESPGSATLIDEQTGAQVGEVDLPPSLIDLSLAPLAVPQLGVGTAFGTDALVRYLPETSLSEFGSVSFLGLALRHDVDQYLPPVPVDIAVQGSWQSLDLSGTEQDDIVEATGWAVNAQVSRSVALLTFYGGVQYETFDVDVEYILEDPTGGQTTLALDQSASNNVRGLAGISLTLGIVRVNVDYALSNNDTISAGLGLIL